ncbi:alpha/beta hydrolase [Flavivirga rizhaonensis]|uniref:1,4-beta-xylanase n=1 Tax=Flavivirga rizhaonensis TaxID=2559571 RepID=A0A4V3P4J6_9FLAO|nr:alpha/beta hydrolase-fold protein [Flavivirga rizhaonensis]TGV01644.1 1,4-beta-xylanase [Flavivirga rizhaonensis]
MKKILLLLLFFLMFLSGVKAQTREHKWVNEMHQKDYNNLIHLTYFSKIHQTAIGYTIALPQGYEEKKNANKKYPVVYFLHGGTPGNETRTGYYNYVKPNSEIDSITSIIYVWNNGGKNKSHYDFPQINSYGESSFIKELIPHIDSTYRTIPDRMARGLQGYSMGGRAAARYIFKYPDLFSVSVSMAGGHQHEKKNSESKGNNSEYQPTDNSWDLAKIYSENPVFPIKLYVFVGTEDMNYEANVAWTTFLKDLGIHHSFTTIEGLNHRELKKMMEQLGPKTLHFMLYQNFKNTIEKYNK